MVTKTSDSVVRGEKTWTFSNSNVLTNNSTFLVKRTEQKLSTILESKRRTYVQILNRTLPPCYLEGQLSSLKHKTKHVIPNILV